MHERNKFTAVFERDGEWYVAHCPEVPDANGQGRTIEECRSSLADAIALILDERRREHLPLTAAQRRELERRLADSVAQPQALVPWEIVKARLLARRGDSAQV